MESETRTHYRAHTQHQSAHSNRQLSPIQVRHAPADREWRDTLVIAIKCRNPPATRRRRIRLRASTNLRGRAASRSALVQPSSRPLRSLCEPTVHLAVHRPVHPPVHRPVHRPVHLALLPAPRRGPTQVDLHQLEAPWRGNTAVTSEIPKI